MSRLFLPLFSLPFSPFYLLISLIFVSFSGLVHANTTATNQDGLEKAVQAPLQTSSKQGNLKQGTSKQALKIVTSIRPLALLAQELVAPEDEVIQLLTADRSPHHYQLTVSDRQKMEQADLIVWVGADLETFLQKPLRSYKGRLLTAAQIKDIHWPEDDHEHHSESKESETRGKDAHNHDRDPHLWLDPYNLALIASAISEALVSLRPQNKAIYLARKDDILRDLAALDKRLQAELPAVADTPFIVMHPAYGHFVERYALNQQDYIVTTPERGIGAKHLYELKRLSVACVFGEEGENDKLAKKVAQYSKSRVALLDPLGLTLADTASAGDIINRLAEELSSCLSNKKAVK